VNTAPTDAERRAALIACERLIAEEVPYAPVFFAIRTQLVHPSVRGWRNNAVQQIDWRELSVEAPK